MGDLLGSPRVAPPPFCVIRVVLLVALRQVAFLTRRLRSLALRKTSDTGLETGFWGRGRPQPGEPGLGGGGLTCLGESSSGMGDLLGSPRVAPPPFCVSRVVLLVALRQVAFLTRRLRSLALRKTSDTGLETGFWGRGRPQPGEPGLGGGGLRTSFPAAIPGP
ncbi:hypothetical protein VNO77_23049 [Canavalia gladiata]|uniref:Uncharacterized protein n=1 Tax=Canavalia gladiata TaxID=3824 RepID=A0AAN9L6B5_CANGL